MENKILSLILKYAQSISETLKLNNIYVESERSETFIFLFVTVLYLSSTSKSIQQQHVDRIKQILTSMRIFTNDDLMSRIETYDDVILNTNHIRLEWNLYPKADFLKK